MAMGSQSSSLSEELLVVTALKIICLTSRLLELLARSTLGSLHSLHEAEPRFFDFLLLFCLCLLKPVICFLQFLDRLIEGGLGILELCILLVDLCLQLQSTHLHELLDLLLLVSIAEVD